ncbi:DOPA 4,5-dioxygenase family protein [Siccirubricoccus phaeus]|uniref:DOPA 4,5-dioxygenase family protein n=1 Tax=Siccirubricoccus phaeus TaxID=2595053 RepID=UPI001F283D26|nr:DOPA 4,5-dioxygenase family protein [Siccirubricoccus phaeus]
MAGGAPGDGGPPPGQAGGPGAGTGGPILGWHAHLYYATPEERALAAAIRAEIAALFPAAVLGRWRDGPVGPHPRAMYQVAFGPGLFPAFVPWLALNRRGLTVLLHPETGRQRADHSAHAMWLGEVLPLKLEVLPA